MPSMFSSCQPRGVTSKRVASSRPEVGAMSKVPTARVVVAVDAVRVVVAVDVVRVVVDWVMVVALVLD